MAASSTSVVGGCAAAQDLLQVPEESSRIKLERLQPTAQLAVELPFQGNGYVYQVRTTVSDEVFIGRGSTQDEAVEKCCKKAVRFIEQYWDPNINGALPPHLRHQKKRGNREDRSQEYSNSQRYQEPVDVCQHNVHCLNEERGGNSPERYSRGASAAGMGHKPLGKRQHSSSLLRPRYYEESLSPYEEEHYRGDGYRFGRPRAKAPRGVPRSRRDPYEFAGDEYGRGTARYRQQSRGQSQASSHGPVRVKAVPRGIPMNSSNMEPIVRSKLRNNRVEDEPVYDDVEVARPKKAPVTDAAESTSTACTCHQQKAPAVKQKSRRKGKPKEYDSFYAPLDESDGVLYTGEESEAFEKLPDDIVLKPNVPIKNAVMMLNELFPPPKAPQYKVTSQTGPPNNPTFTMVCTINNKSFVGEGKSKKEAKLSCSQKAIEVLYGYKMSETKSVPERSNPRANCDLDDWMELEGKNPVSILNELYPGIQYQLISTTGPSHAPVFVIRASLNDKAFEGSGKSKKDAKLNASKALLVHLHKVAFDPMTGDMMSTMVDNGGVSEGHSFADQIGQLVTAKYQMLFGTTTYSKRRVMAGIVMTRNGNVADSGEVVCVSSGTKCINGEQLSLNGCVINDSHAEIVTRRCLVVFLYSQLMMLTGKRIVFAKERKKDSKESEEKNEKGLPSDEEEPERLQDESLDENNNDKMTESSSEVDEESEEDIKEKSIFVSCGDGKYELKEGIEFHLFITTSPCGDARIFSLHEAAKDKDNRESKDSGDAEKRTELTDADKAISVAEENGNGVPAILITPPDSESNCTNSATEDDQVNQQEPEVPERCLTPPPEEQDDNLNGEELERLRLANPQFPFPIPEIKVEFIDVDDFYLDSRRPDSSRGMLRSKIECGMGTVPIKPKVLVQTWDGVMSGDRLLTMACSDKILRWNVLGIQGALLTHLIKPVYLKTVTVGSKFHPGHMKRALYERITPHISQLPDCYTVNKPELYVTTSPETRQATKAHDYSVNWIEGHGLPEIVNGSTGKTINDCTSRLSKRSLFGYFLDISKELAGRPFKSPVRYSEVKRKAVDYQVSKSELIQALHTAGCGHWIEKPIEQDQFTL